MKVLRSNGEADLTYVLLTDAEIAALRDALRKRKMPFARELRKALKAVLPRG